MSLIERVLIERALIERGLIVRGSLASLAFRGMKMSTDPLVLFGLRLAEVRREKGYSQERLAIESGVARSYLSGVERGNRNIALLNIIKLAVALGVEPKELFEMPEGIEE